MEDDAFPAILLPNCKVIGLASGARHWRDYMRETSHASMKTGLIGVSPPGWWYEAGAADGKRPVIKGSMLARQLPFCIA
jgi:small ligand-binding sensory domain FIST